jgi:hypothetical protein
MVKFLQWIALPAYIGLALSVLLALYAYEQRGYWAVGGEWLFAIVIPYLAGLWKLAKWQNKQ